MSSPSNIAQKTDFKGAIAAIASISSVGTALGLSSPLLAIILDQRGYSATVIGANAATAGIASMIAVWLVAPMASRFGVTWTLAIAAVVAAASLIGFYLFESIEMWFLLRVFFNGALTLSFVLSEFWINSAAAEKQRGLMLGVYATILSLGFGIGPAILAYTGSGGFMPFGLATVIMLASTLPVVLAKDREPVIEVGSGSRNAFISYVWLVPLATGAVFVFGAVEQSILPMLPVYGLQIGYSEYQVSLLLVVVAAGNVCFNIPVGIWSDRMKDRRHALYTCGIIGALGTAALPWASTNTVFLVCVIFVWGGMISGLYTVGLAHLGSRLKGRELANANSAFVFCYTLGMIIGPQLAGISMDRWPPHGFVWAMFSFFAAYLVLCVFRAWQRR
jgi:MFS family permease